MNFKEKGLIILLLVLVVNSYASYAQLKQGDVAADVKYIDVDEFWDFAEGRAVVTKNSVRSIMDEKGNFIVPFGKYKLDTYPGFRNGYCGVQDVQTKKYGFIDKNGTEVVPCKYTVITEVSSDGFCELGDDQRVRMADGNTTYTYRFYYHSMAKKQSNLVYTRSGDLRNHKSTIQYSPKFTSEVGYILPGEESGYFYKKGLYGFMKRDGSITIVPTFKTVGNFSEGMAQVKLYDSSTAITKVGFIDRTGKLVISYKYIGMVGDFHNGLAMVQGSPGDNFAFGYINKKGEVIVSLQENATYKHYGIADPTAAAVDIYSGQTKYHEYGLRSMVWHTYNNVLQTEEYFLIDSSGRRININELYTKMKYAPELVDGVDAQWDLFPVLLANKWLRFKIRNSKNEYLYGAIDLKGNIIFAPIFTELSLVAHDPGLFRASIKRDGQVHNGYINEQGIFVILQRPMQ